MKNPQETIRLGRAAKALKTHADFASVLDEIRAEQVSAFTDGTAEDVDAWKEAHAILRALNAVTSRLDWMIAEGNQAEKDQDRVRHD